MKDPLLVLAHSGCVCSFCAIPVIESEPVFADATQGSAWICRECLRQANGDHASYDRANAKAVS